MVLDTNANFSLWIINVIYKILQLHYCTTSVSQMKKQRTKRIM